MGKNSNLFDTFLSHINPDEQAVKHAQEAHTRVRECLETDDKFKEYVVGSFLYGSYKRRTAVGSIKDVDVVIMTNFDIYDEENTPHKVLKKLKAALARCYDDPENLEYQRRSIRVDDPLPDHPDAELTLDIIPAVATSGDDEPLYVPDREQKEWIQSHPKGHLRYISDLNSDEVSSGRFVPLAKIMKWWWKYQCEVRQPDVERPKPKGFWVECLTAENFDPELTSFAEHFIAVLKSISEKYSEAETVPELDDPGIPTQPIKTNMEFEEFDLFMTTVTESLEKAEQALAEPDPLNSSELWRELFGEQFPLYDAEETEETRKSASAIRIDDLSHIEPLRWRVERRNGYRVHIDAYVYLGNRKMGGINSNGRVVMSGSDIKYVAHTNARGSYEVYWQVVNTGQHARSVECLRGTFFRARQLDKSLSFDQLVNWESTAYTGKHWIECFIIKDGVCVARSGRFYLNVRNPEFP